MVHAVYFNSLFGSLKTTVCTSLVSNIISFHEVLDLAFCLGCHPPPPLDFVGSWGWTFICQPYHLDCAHTHRLFSYLICVTSLLPSVSPCRQPLQWSGAFSCVTLSRLHRHFLLRNPCWFGTANVLFIVVSLLYNLLFIICLLYNFLVICLLYNIVFYFC